MEIIPRGGTAIFQTILFSERKKPNAKDGRGRDESWKEPLWKSFISLHDEFPDLVAFKKKIAVSLSYYSLVSLTAKPNSDWYIKIQTYRNLFSTYFLVRSLETKLRSYYFSSCLFVIVTILSLVLTIRSSGTKCLEPRMMYSQYLWFKDWEIGA